LRLTFRLAIVVTTDLFQTEQPWHDQRVGQRGYPGRSTRKIAATEPLFMRTLIPTLEGMYKFVFLIFQIRLIILQKTKSSFT